MLLFDTTPVAFGALGIPITTLAKLTGLPDKSIAAMLGRQLPLFSLFLPLYGLAFYAGIRPGIIECWPLAMVAGLSFAVTQVSMLHDTKSVSKRTDTPYPGHLRQLGWTRVT